MPNPRKRKGGKQIGRLLSAGSKSESDFTTSEIDAILELARYGHDGDGAFAQESMVPSGSNAGAGTPIGQRVLNEDCSVKTVAAIVALSSSAIFDSGSNPAATTSAGGIYDGALWADAVKRYYVAEDTTKIGMSATSPATAQYGIAHSPNGPDSKFVGSLLNMGDREFRIRPDTWVAGHELKILIDSQEPDLTFKIVQGDTGATVGAVIAGHTSGSAHSRTINHHADNDTNGLKIEISGTVTGSTDQLHNGYYIAWAVQDQ